MANSPAVSIRIPPETLERIDHLAQKLYPSRRVGKNPNRSQLILDAINQFLEQHESSYVKTPSIEEATDEEQINNTLQDKQIDHKPINNIPQPYPNYMEPTIRKYVDWWSDYFSYMKKITDVWLGYK
jgi:predicted DNA-binding protein